ncbi:hypothetical protein C0995_014159 [Termitomyces sp. Mi166|nr:hypothetical protein C0995_014159 [Termitomyces sp. Mi166\
MDELLHHCLRELSFDGDLGCSVSRLRDFIVDFYTHNGTPQNPDDAFCAFVWSLVAQQPTVRIGTVPPGVASEVWIAPQVSAKRKAKAKGEEHVETTPTQLDIVHGARDRFLDDLQKEYGDDLRIAVDPDAIYAAITGSHIRFAKLSPMVYSALQIITRGRDNGVTVVELGQQSKYDQKTCFYLVRQLTELDLVPHWKAIREEENEAESSHKKIALDSTTDVYEEEERSADVQSLDFTPIDARHLSSLPLIRGRVVKLLKASKNQMHASNNMLITLGFANPTKTDRRFFQSRIREMIQQGVIEKVVVPSNNRKSPNASVKCFRLVSRDRTGRDDEGVVVQSQDGDDDEKEVGEQSGVKMNITIHKQIFDLLEESGMVGMTLNELSAALCQFDKRTIELLLTRAEKFPPPSHLSDLGIAGLMETSGRERRHRYFTVASYRQLLAKEKLDNSNAGYSEVDFSDVGEFLPVDSNLFYDDQDALRQYQDSFKDTEKLPGKRRTPKNPILADGSVKQGRPRKYPVGEDPKSLRKQVKKRKLEEAALAENEENAQSAPSKRRRFIATEEADSTPENIQVPKKRGRPPKGKQKESDQPQEETPPPAKKRGRSSKAASQANADETALSANKRVSTRKSGTTTDEVPSTSRKRARIKPGAKSFKAALAEMISGDEAESGSSKHTRFASEPPGDLESSVIVLDQPDGSNENTASDLSAAPEPSQVASSNAQISNQSTTIEPPLEQPVPSCASFTRTDPPQTSSTFSAQTTQLQPLLSPSQSIPHEMISTSDSSPHPCLSGISSDTALVADILEYAGQIRHNASVSLSFTVATPSNHLTSLIKGTDSPLENPRQESTPQTSLSTLGADMQKMSSSLDTVQVEDGPIQEASPKGARVNVSHLRRENELYRVVENMGGIVNIQTKDFFEEHIALLEAMTKAGEPTSAPPGTRTDKRTAVSTFNNLEKRGRIKQLKTSVMTHTGVRRPACIVYLPTISQEKLNAFLAELSRGVQSTPHPGNFVKIDEHVEYGADPSSIPRGALPLQLLQMEQPGDDRKERWSKNVARAEQLFSYDDSVIRDVLLTERTTLAQLYGFIVGKAVRCREFHLSTLNAFENRNPSSNIISHEKRILDLSFFGHDIPLGLYCSLVSSLSHSDELTKFIATPEGRETLVRDLPSTLNSTLQIGRSRARSRFLDILETLRSLKLVTPLQSSKSDRPWITCEENEGRPSAFDIASLEGWTVSTPMAAPTYWHFNDTAPIHVWAASETCPPFWQDVAVGSTTSAMNFWHLLKEASTRTDIVISTNAASATGPPNALVSVVRSLRRQVSWNSEYILTWHQSQYLRQFVDAATGKTPLQDDDGGFTQIEKISWVISAPQQSVRSFFHATHLKLLRDIEKLRKKAAQAAVEKKAKRAAATKASLAKKAADARQLREEEWDNMVRRLYPTPLEPAAEVRIRRIRVRFLQAGSIKDLGKWEDEIHEAVREANMVAKKVLKGATRRTFPTRTIPVPMDPEPLTVAVNPPEKPVETLIAMQGPPLAPRQDKVKRKRNAKNAEVPDEATEPKPKTLRRHRFQWNRDYEELARDASAIIRARCRNLPRLDWAAFEQVFPAVPRNTVRQRLAHIRETPGNEAYLNRLEDRWYEIWMQHRGTPLLPDDDPMSASNFNLIKHVGFLRQHVDKNALRVGFAQPKENAGTTLSASVDMLLTEYDVVESTPNVPSWDFVWNAVVEEGREKQMLRQPFLNTPEDMPPVGEIPLEAVSLAESALKMTLGTPHERYDSEHASTLLHTIGEHYVSIATKNLLTRGVLSKLVRDPQKEKPGRQLKISEGNQNAVGGSILRETFQDAALLEELSLQEGGTWREWPLTASDGDSAALIQLVSENKASIIPLYTTFFVLTSHKVEFKVDTSHAQSCRPTLDWNSKKADDDQIETAVHVRTIVTSLSQPQQIPTPKSSPARTMLSLPTELNPAHGQSVDGGIASCRRLTNAGLADCMVCLEEEWTSFNDGLSPEERELAMHILTIVRHGAEHGVTKSHLRKMTESPVPMLFWAGYSSLVLVSSAYIKNWTVLVSENPATRIFPRRWLDISGRKLVDFWEAALKAVMSIIVFHPGITQAELRWRLRSVYDRQEVGDLVRFLEEDGSLNMRIDPAIEWNNVNVAALDDREEKGVFWQAIRGMYLMNEVAKAYILSKFYRPVSAVVMDEKGKQCSFEPGRFQSGYWSLHGLTIDPVVSMRVKQLWNSVPASSKLVIKAFTINADAATFLYDIVVEGNAINDTSLPILRGNSLYMCLNLENCSVVWNAEGLNMLDSEDEGSVWSTTSSRLSETVITSASISTSTVTPISTSLFSSPTSSLWSSAIASAPIASVTDSVVPSTVTVFVGPATTSPIISDDVDDDDSFHERRELFTRGTPRILPFEEDSQISVNISGMGFKDTGVILNPTSDDPSSLDNTIREDFVFIAFQFWVLGMSVVALLNESIPHILASLVTHMMATAWAAFQIKNTGAFKSNFTRVITNGACSGVSMSLLFNYWDARRTAEITSLAFNVLAFLISCVLTWRLFKPERQSFGWQTFKRVGASLTINRIYKIVLTLSITIQLSMFFMAVTVSLWIDRLFNSPIGDLVDFETLYKVTSFITLVLLVPWLMTGWFAVRRELRVPMFIFLVLSIWYLGGWSVMFFSTTFRWNFVTWTFFSIMATTSVLLTVVSLVLGVVCRYNFGKGLLRYLNANQNLPDDDFRYYEGSDEEKVDFPSNEKPVPTFAAAFGTRPELSRSNIAEGPRFFNSSAKSFETTRISPVTPPPNAYTIARKLSSGSSQSSSDSRVMRSDTRSSGKSFGSLVL